MNMQLVGIPEGTPTLEKLAISKTELEWMLGSYVATRLIASGDLKPVVDRHKNTLFDRKAVNAAWERVVSGDIDL